MGRIEHGFAGEQVGASQHYVDLALKTLELVYGYGGDQEPVRGAACGFIGRRFWAGDSGCDMRLLARGRPMDSLILQGWSYDSLVGIIVRRNIPLLTSPSLIQRRVPVGVTGQCPGEDGKRCAEMCVWSRGQVIVVCGGRS
jgi:hypothetical protein